MKSLNNILEGIKFTNLIGKKDIPISHLELDSRAVGNHGVFIAMKGTVTDGHNYIDKAIENGAAAIVCEILPKQINENCTYLVVKNSGETLGILAANFYNKPSESLKLVAVTGTNGKTSIATMLFQLFSEMGYVCGLLSTVENKIGNAIIPSTHTTPNAIAINAIMFEMVEAGCTYCFMEASSHAIHQKRMYGLDIDGAVFTNLSHDHLDYHNSFKEYLLAKKMLFDTLPKEAFALSNGDDKNGMVMLQNTAAQKSLYAITGRADFSGRVLESDFGGMMMNIDGKEVHVKLIGGFNAYNILAVYGTALLLGHDETEVLIALSTIEGAEGRFEYIVSEVDQIVGIIDYAHTPDALKKVLETTNQLNSKGNNLITVVGCGGDRDKSKRPLMAAIAAKLSSKVVFTSDNPRTENPKEILEEMQVGVAVADRKKTLVIENRAQAIKTACMLAEKEDIILVAGKGHENYQDIDGVKHAFDDKEELEKAFKELDK